MIAFLYNFFTKILPVPPSFNNLSGLENFALNAMFPVSLLNSVSVVSIVPLYG
jgi:hypothetical protein